MTSETLNRSSTNQSQLSFLHRLADLPARDAERAWRKTLRDELDLPIKERRRGALERAHAWLAIEDVDRVMTDSFEEALGSFEPSEAAEIITLEADAAVHGLSLAEYRRLAQVLPWLEARATETERSGERRFAAPTVLASLVGFAATNKP